MEHYLVVSINDLFKHVTAGSRVASEVLSPPQTIYVPPFSPCPAKGTLYHHLGNQGYKSRAKRLTLHVIDGDIRVKGPYGIVTVNGLAIGETLTFVAQSQTEVLLRRHNLGRIENRGELQYYIPSPSDEVISLVHPCLLSTSFAPKKNYGHFWLDHIGKIATWHEFPERIPADICALIPGISNTFWEETMMRIAEQRSRPLTFFPIQEHQEIRLSRLFYIDGISPEYVVRIRPQFYEFTRRLSNAATCRLTKDQYNSVCGIGEKIFLSRRDDTRRANTVVDEIIESAFQRRGYDIIHPKELSVTQKMAICSRAKVLAGRFGSGNFNMLFAPKESILAEIQPPFKVTPTLRHMVACGSQKYAGLIGTNVADTADSGHLAQHESWQVSTEEIHELVDYIETL